MLLPQVCAGNGRLPGHGRWPVGAVKVSPEAPCQISQWLESLLRWLDQWRRERFGKGSHGQCQGDTCILGCAAGESVPSRSRLPHGSTDDGISAAPLLPSGEFSHCRGQSEWSLIHALTFGFRTVLHISTKRLWTFFYPAHRRWIAGMTSTTRNTTVGQSTVRMITIWSAVVVSFLFNSLNYVNSYCKLSIFFPFCGPEGSMWSSAVCTHTCTVWMCVFRRRMCVCVFIGLEMAWVQRPPEKVTNGEEFNVSYTVTASDSFYDYAVRNRIFQFRWARLVASAWNPCAVPSKRSRISSYAHKGPEQILQSIRILHVLIYFPWETCQNKQTDQIYGSLMVSCYTGSSGFCPWRGLGWAVQLLLPQMGFCAWNLSLFL